MREYATGNLRQPPNQVYGLTELGATLRDWIGLPKQLGNHCMANHRKEIGQQC
jgi:hypothetical protein